MPKFRKKPVEVEAVQFNGTDESVVAIMQLQKPVKGGVARAIDIDHGGKTIFIHTLEGKMEASLNDWIIKGVEGEIYPCKPEIFKKTYDEVK